MIEPVCPESTIESANRRNFIKKAALVTAAAGVGSVIGERALSRFPESSAASSTACPVRTTTVSGNGIGNIAVFNGYRCCGCYSIGTCITGDLGSVCQGCCSYNQGASLSESLAGVITGSCICCPRCPSGGAVLNVTNSFHGKINCPLHPCAYPVAISATTQGVNHPIPPPPGAVGILGAANNGAGILGQSNSGFAVAGFSNSPVTGLFRNTGNSANKTAAIQIQNGCSTPVAWNAGVGGAGESHGVTNGQFFLGHCGPKMVLATCGKVGIGTIAPNATLQVNGGVSVGTKIKTGNYTMTASDFAVFVNSGSGKVKITLPAASTTGQMVHIKKIDSSKNIVIVARAGTDTIEGSPSKTLSAQYHSLTLIAAGNGVWYILSNAT